MSAVGSCPASDPSASRVTRCEDRRIIYRIHSNQYRSCILFVYGARRRCRAGARPRAGAPGGAAGAGGQGGHHTPCTARAPRPRRAYRIRIHPSPHKTHVWRVASVASGGCLACGPSAQRADPGYYRKEQWLVKWKGYGDDRKRNTWEPWEHLLTEAAQGLRLRPNRSGKLHSVLAK